MSVKVEYARGSGIEEGEEMNLIRSLFPAMTAEEWAEDPEQEHYLNALTSFDMGKIMHEPVRIENRKKTIQSETQSLAFRNYKAFVQTAECSREIYEKFNETSSHVDEFLDALPEFREVCSKFEEKCEKIGAKRRQIIQLLKMHGQMVEILEIPQLAETCIRNSHYEEALELTVFVERLRRKHSDIPIVQSIVEDVVNSRNLMLSQLLSTLEEQIQLPECLRVVGFLRRLDVYSEVELRIKFLKTRDVWLFSTVESAEHEDPFSYVAKVIEICRVNIFDIITQYRAVFSEEYGDYGFSSIASSDSASKSAGMDLKNILTSWANQKVVWFWDILEPELEKIGDGSSISSLLSQCMYFGMSMGRVGMDFRNVIAGIFEKRILRLYVGKVEGGVSNFSETLESHAALQMSKALLVRSSRLRRGASLSKTDKEDEDSKKESSEEVYAPPSGLLEHPSMAVLCNVYLNALNDLSRCAPLSLSFSIADATAVSLGNIAKSLEKYTITNDATLGTDDKDVLKSICHCFCVELVPHVIKCLSCVYESSMNETILSKANLKQQSLTSTLMQMCKDEKQSTIN
eukprot:Nk52_evm12s2462 gene=Nk52_evmTU12s2462